MKNITVVQGTQPLVLDSPHSGTDYPDDFGYRCDVMDLRQSEDTYVNRLFVGAAQLGVGWLEAHFPRSYIDVNRASDEIDPAMVQGAAPREGTAKTEMGAGLIWRKTLKGDAIYADKLPMASVLHRIENYWQPYHYALAQLIDQVHAKHGLSLHLNCHSMPSKHPLYQGHFVDATAPDFILGNHDHSSSDKEWIASMESYLTGLGYKVLVNHVFKGAELTRAYADPAQGRHSIQIEINRSLYMNETSFELTPHFEHLQQQMFGLVRHLLSVVEQTKNSKQTAERCVNLSDHYQGMS
jgi:N-formylglutamate deformylase